MALGLTLLVDNVEINVNHKLKLLDQETDIRNDISNTRWCKGDLSSEDVEILRQSSKSELADVMEKKKSLSFSRKALKFFYPV